MEPAKYIEGVPHFEGASNWKPRQRKRISIMLVFCVLLAAAIGLLIYVDVSKPKRFPKGPAWFPVVGNFSYFKKRLSELGFHHLVWDELSKQYGNVVGLRLGRNLVVAVSGPEAVKEILTRDEFEGRPDGFFFQFRTFGKRLGIVFSDGPFWQKQRKFSINHLRHFGFGKKEMELKIEDEARELVEMLRKGAGRPTEMQNAFDISVLNVLWTMMAGNRFALDDARLTTLLTIIHDAFKMNDMSGGLLNQMPFLRFVAPDACGYTRIDEILTRLFKFLRETIDEHKETVCSTHSRDLIDAFLQKMHVPDKDETFTDEQLLSLCLDLFMAGSETTSNTLSFAMLYMLRHPEVQKKVQAEMDEIVGGNRWPTLQDRTKLPYTEAVIMEIQRRTNVPPLGIAHRAMRDAELMGRMIPEGTIVLTNLFSIHMDPVFWKDPEVFRPERFLSGNGKISIPEKHYAPFGYGKRRCLGESLAKCNLFLFFTSILHKFNIELDPSGPEPDLNGQDGITLSPKPFNVILTERDNC